LRPARRPGSILTCHLMYLPIFHQISEPSLQSTAMCDDQVCIYYKSRRSGWIPTCNNYHPCLRLSSY
jgi:hypothetical protein